MNEASVHLSLRLCDLNAVLQAAMRDGLPFDAFGLPRRYHG